MNHEIPCDPPPGAYLTGYVFRRDQRGDIIARCALCQVGFVVTAATAEAMRANMIMHLDAVHGTRS